MEREKEGPAEACETNSCNYAEEFLRSIPNAGEEIFYLSVSELANASNRKKLSPVELTQAYLDRSQKLGPRFNAYARLTPEIALEQAKAAEKEIQRGH